jgi:hypothetical protein
MAKSSPEKLAQALRANLKRRKQPKAAAQPEPSPEGQLEPAARPAQKPSKNGG